ncbi:MAG: metallophosphoesterase family protein [Methanomicrobiales archaeon]|nr:metallophosphoesterase family protein [Methanomicrobiales archaeon]
MLERDGELQILDGRKVWFISDLHFGHKGIIPWCRADSFINIEEMHRVLIKNWNSAVDPDDRIFCLGDFGRLKFRSQLKGHIIMTQGNHDTKQWDKQYILRYRNTKFLVVHDPKTAPDEYDGEWVVHGHSHRTAPFVDAERRRVNVSCEVLRYCPVTMEQIYAIVRESEQYPITRWEL